MNKEQVGQVLDYLDMEYCGITAKMTDDERKLRAKHWAQEIGALDFDDVMTAVRKLSQGPYMPRTAEIIREVQDAPKMPKTSAGPQSCRIEEKFAGTEVYQLRNADGSIAEEGILNMLPDWQILKYRWIADPNPENTAAWDNCMMQIQGEDQYAAAGMFAEVDALMAAVGGVA